MGIGGDLRSDHKGISSRGVPVAEGYVSATAPIEPDIPKLKPLAQRQQGQEGFGRVRPKLAGERHRLHR